MIYLSHQKKGDKSYDDGRDHQENRGTGEPQVHAGYEGQMEQG